MKLLAIAIGLAAVHLVLRLCGLGVHASVIAGMPQNDFSFVLGPIYILSWLAFVAIAPVCAIAAALLSGFRWARSFARPRPESSPARSSP